MFGLRRKGVRAVALAALAVASLVPCGVGGAPEAGAGAAERRTYAILIGNDDYSKVKWPGGTIDSLPTCVNDVLTLERTLAADRAYQQGRIHRFVRLSEESNVYDDPAAMRQWGSPPEGVTAKPDWAKADVTKQLQMVSRVARKTDTVLVFFSGHGVMYNGQLYFIIPGSDFTDEGRRRVTCLTFFDVVQALVACPAPVVFLFDACESGGQTRSQVTREYLETVFEASKNDGSRWVSPSCKGDESSTWLTGPDWKPTLGIFRCNRGCTLRWRGRGSYGPRLGRLSPNPSLGYC